MKMLKKIWIVNSLLAFTAMSCKKQISAAAITAPNSYLVVNGNITVNDITTISLSRPTCGFTAVFDCTLRGTNKLPSFWK